MDGVQARFSYQLSHRPLDPLLAVVMAVGRGVVVAQDQQPLLEFGTSQGQADVGASLDRQLPLAGLLPHPVEVGDHRRASH